MQVCDIEVIYGMRCLFELQTWLSQHHVCQIGLVVSPHVPQYAIYQQMLASLEQEYPLQVSYIYQEAGDDEIDEIAALFLAKEVNCVIGIGGGKVLDSAKALALLHATHPHSMELKGKTKIRKQRLLVCIPTTIGTGSEVSETIVIMDHRDHRKKRIITSAIKPDLVVLEPLLTMRLDTRTITNGAIDTLAHALEAITNQHFLRYPSKEIWKHACYAISLVLEQLPTLLTDIYNVQAHESLQWAALFGGLCLTYDLNACHVLAGAIQEAYPHLTHGEAVGMLLGDLLHLNEQSCQATYAQIELFLKQQIAPQEVLSQRFLARIDHVLSYANILQLEDLKELACNELKARLYQKLPQANALNPQIITMDDVTRLLKKHKSEWAKITDRRTE